MKDEPTSIEKMLPGAIALLILAILWGPLNFYPWLVESLIIYAGTFFLINVIIKTIVKRNFDKKNLKSMFIGVLAISLAFLLNQMTLKELIEIMLQATAIFSIFYTIFTWVHDKVNNI